MSFETISWDLVNRRVGGEWLERGQFDRFLEAKNLVEPVHWTRIEDGEHLPDLEVLQHFKGPSAGACIVVPDSCYFRGVGPFRVERWSDLRVLCEWHLEQSYGSIFDGDAVFLAQSEAYIGVFHHSGWYAEA